MTKICLFLGALTLVVSSRTAHAQQLFDVDLTKGNAGKGVVRGGAWEKGWRVTQHGQRIVWDAGRQLKNGRFEVWFTMKQNPLDPAGKKGQWIGLHGQPDLDLAPQYLQLRAGRPEYQFSKLRMKGEGSVRCEITGGALADWKQDDKTVMRVVIEWKDGVPSFTDPSGKVYRCTSYHKATGPIVQSSLRWAFIGSDNSEEGAGVVGVRFLRARLTELPGRDASAVRAPDKR